MEDKRQVPPADAPRQIMSQLLAEALELVPTGLCLIDTAGRFAHVNDAYCRIYGYTREELLGQPMVLIVPPEETPAAQAALAQVLGGDRAPHPLNQRLRRRKDGTIIWVEGQAALLVGQDGQRLALFTITDITARKEAEAALATRTAQLEAVQAVSVEITRELDLERLLQLITHRAADILSAGAGAVYLWNLESQTLRRQGAYGIVPATEERPRRLGEGVVGVVAERREGLVVADYPASPYALPYVIDPPTSVVAEPLLYRDRLLGVLLVNNRGSGRVFSEADREALRLFASQAAIAIENARLFSASQEELAARKQAEAALRESQTLLLALTESTPDLIFVKDLQGRYLMVNAAVCVITGKAREEILGQDDMVLFPADVGRSVIAHDREVLAAGTSQMYEEVLSLGGKPRTLLIIKGPLIDPRGTPLGLFGIARDITPLKQAEAALREREQQLALAIAGSGVGLWDWRVRTGEVTFNERWAEIAGYALSELAPISLQTWKDLCHPEDLVKSAAIMEQHFAGEIPVYECEVRMRHKDGHWVWALDRGTVTERAADGTPLRMTGTHLDITTRKQLEEERLIRSKLEATGILAGGIAHDFNNLLTVILGNLELFELSGETERAAHLDKARTAVTDAHGLTQQFLALAEGGAPRRQTLTLAELLDTAVSAALKGAPIECDLRLPTDLWPVLADPQQLGLAIRNLVLNAREAMPAGRRITLQAQNVPTPAPTVLVTMADQGPGIPPDLLPRIFDPYFSTKQRGGRRGMGLGLTVARTIIEKHGGTLTVTSTVGVGTTVRMTLPAMPSPLASARLSSGAAAASS